MLFDSCGHQKNGDVRYDCSKLGSETVFWKFLFFLKYLIFYKCTSREYRVNVYVKREKCTSLSSYITSRKCKNSERLTNY